MTYKELADIIMENKDQWNNDVTVFYVKGLLNDGYFPIRWHDFTVETDVMDDNHLILGF
jgi:hypothetical protein